MNCPICDQTETHFLSCGMPEYLLHIEASHKEQYDILKEKYESAILELSRRKNNETG